jgi:hypothetical protein
MNRLGAAFLLVLLAATRVEAAECTKLNSIGRIEKIDQAAGEAPARVVRAGGGEAPLATAYLVLCRGDSFVLSPGTTVQASFGPRPCREFTAARPAIPDECAGPPEPELRSAGMILALIHAQLNGRDEGRREAIPVFLLTRGAPSRISADPLLPPGRQLVPRGDLSLAFVWRDAPGILAVGGRGVQKGGEENSMLIALPAAQSELTVRANGSDFSWEVSRAAAVPVPPGLAEAELSTHAGRAARAVWLLSQGPEHWQLFALSELAALSRDEYFLGDQLWTMARNGELADALRAR